MIPESVYEAVLDYGKASMRVGRATLDDTLSFEAALDNMIEAQGHLLDLLHANEKET